MKSQCKHILAAFFMMILGTTAMAGGKTLMKYKGGTIKPDLASAVTKVKDGKYEFTLKAGITPAMVKASIEKKLKKFKGKVSAKGASAVVITFSGDEKKFLKKVSKSRIKKGGGANLAVESSVSDGGIRAKTAARDPKANEVKGQVIAVKGDTIKMIVTTAGSASGAKNGQIIMVSGRGQFTPKKKDTIFFQKVSTKPWKGSHFTDK